MPERLSNKKTFPFLRPTACVPYALSMSRPHCFSTDNISLLSLSASENRPHISSIPGNITRCFRSIAASSTSVSCHDASCLRERTNEPRLPSLCAALVKLMLRVLPKFTVLLVTRWYKSWQSAHACPHHHMMFHTKSDKRAFDALLLISAVENQASFRFACQDLLKIP